jgi:hypothetical protein
MKLGHHQVTLEDFWTCLTGPRVTDLEQKHPGLQVRVLTGEWQESPASIFGGLCDLRGNVRGEKTIPANSCKTGASEQGTLFTMCELVGLRP